MFGVCARGIRSHVCVCMHGKHCAVLVSAYTRYALWSGYVYSVYYPKQYKRLAIKKKYITASRSNIKSQPSFRSLTLSLSLCQLREPPPTPPLCSLSLFQRLSCSVRSLRPIPNNIVSRCHCFYTRPYVAGFSASSPHSNPNKPVTIIPAIFRHLDHHRYEQQIAL